MLDHLMCKDLAERLRQANATERYQDESCGECHGLENVLEVGLGFEFEQQDDFGQSENIRLPNRSSKQSPSSDPIPLMRGNDCELQSTIIADRRWKRRPQRCHIVLLVACSHTSSSSTRLNSFACFVTPTTSNILESEYLFESHHKPLRIYL
ncbi:hypothetical protein K435DRAFT_112588 [Dendrothele bispora CBS 962.96]|uniref:Uncharacterized protein n=1 Tax=Dendrothele bispora (strain CBS 962.96) TaxID=1314807 RepID=A0A4S8KNB8_DENBC|nr:hypothetical protein K435DRAFT_112588 [Dendrothele bispora CBS 962.96]